MSKKKVLLIFKRQRMIILALSAAFIILIIIFAATNSWRSSQRQTALEEIEALEGQIEELELAAELAARERPWYLTLINQANPLPDEFEPSLVEVAPERGVDARIGDAVTGMINAAAAEGVHLEIVVAHRSFQRQSEIFLSRMVEINAQGINMFEAYREAARAIEVPGTSEYQAGLAVAFGPTYEVSAETFVASQEMQWLMANARTFGFILRYPENRSDITGAEFNPFHWRYVGVEAATIIAEQNITLEEYLLQH
ncbi:MAG: M15 family metallopeptidase [Lachnospiraceae bacterium]|nr:M15 family metallopeptidase [Lachnospiraceae bacterium]